MKRFLDYFQKTCIRYNITAPEDKYQGLLQYCSDRVLDTLDSLNSSETQDYDMLVKELKYFYGKNEAAYSVGKVEAFTAKWRQRPITSIDQFKRYHRKYLELVGEAKKFSQISLWDYHRYFWEGLPEKFRIKAEYRMLATDPNLDVSVPFEIFMVVKAAEYLLSPNRFDKHLISHTNYLSSETEPEPEQPSKYSKPNKKLSSDSESDNEIRPLFKSKFSESELPSISRIAQPPTLKSSRRSKKEDKDIIELTRKLGDLSLNDQDYTVLFMEIISRDPSLKDVLETPQSRTARLGQRQVSQFPRPPFPQRPFGPPGLGPPRGEMYCFGCGKNGHHIRQCEEINALIQQGVIIKDTYTGRLQWPNGSRIFRTGDETWVQAIKSTKQVNLLRVEDYDDEDTDTVYNYLGITREEDDAGTEDQADLGWASGEVCHYHALSAERAPKVSKNSRKQVQLNVPNASQGMKKFPRGMERHGPGRPQNPIQKNGYINSDQAGPPIRITPIDVNKDKFEGKGDNQFLPMIVDEEVPPKPGNHSGKKLAHQSRTNVPKIPNPGSDDARDSSALVQDILNSPLTLSLREAVRISPKLRKDLVNAAKQEHEASSQIQEKTGFAGKIAYDGDTWEAESSDDQEMETYPTPAVLDPGLAVARDDLIEIPARVGGIPMTGIFDTGSQVSIISQRAVEAAGLPWTRGKGSRVRLLGINGDSTTCIGKVSDAKVLFTRLQVPTYGDLFVNPGKEFNLVIGRTYATANRMGIREEDDGTYLNFKSEGKKYEFNAAPANRRRDEEFKRYGKERMFHDRRNDMRNRVCITAVKEPEARRIAEEIDAEELMGPDMTTEIRTRDLNECEEGREDSLISITEDPPTPAQQPPEFNDEDERPVSESERDVSARGTDSDEDDFDQDNPAGKHERFELDTKSHENYIRLIQSGSSNLEWNAFCRAETDRLKHHKHKWHQLNEDTDDEEDTDDANDPKEKRFARPTAPKRGRRSMPLGTRDPDPMPPETLTPCHPVMRREKCWQGNRHKDRRSWRRVDLSAYGVRVTGGKPPFTQRVRGEFFVSSETKCLAQTHQVH